MNIVHLLLLVAFVLKGTEGRRPYTGQFWGAAAGNRPLATNIPWAGMAPLGRDCFQKADPGPCRGAIEAYYFDATNKRCDTFLYGGCKGNGNRYRSYGECEKRCKRKDKYTILRN